MLYGSLENKYRTLKTEHCGLTKSEKLYQQKMLGKSNLSFEKQNMHVPILAEEYLNRLCKIKKEDEYLKQKSLYIKN